MPIFSWPQLKTITGGQWLVPPRDEEQDVTAIQDDSRSVTAGALFVAIRGRLTDGHKFIPKALENGASAICLQPDCVTSDELEKLRQKPVPVLAVDNPLNAYHRLARAWRRQFPHCTVIGITGSNGKTSLRAILESIFRSAYGDARVLATEGNTNNHFGVPRNLLRLNQAHDVAIIELGTNHPGEIKELAAVVEPDIGAITSIGRSHLEFLGSLEAVAREKAALVQALPPSGIAVLPADGPGQERLHSAAGPRRIVTFGESLQADVKVEYLGRGSRTSYALKFTSRIADLPNPVEWPVGGRHQARNAAAAVAVARAAGVKPNQIIKGLQRTKLPGMRMQTLQQDGVHWINDAYNANPDSTRAAVEWFAEITTQKKIGTIWIVLGDMLELGPEAAREHETLLAWVRQRLPQANILPVGTRMLTAAGKFNMAAWPDAAAVARQLKPRLTPGDWVLLKGSRSMKLELIMES